MGKLGHHRWSTSQEIVFFISLTLTSTALWRAEGRVNWFPESRSSDRVRSTSYGFGVTSATAAIDHHRRGRFSSLGVVVVAVHRSRKCSTQVTYLWRHWRAAWWQGIIIRLASSQKGLIFPLVQCVKILWLLQPMPYIDNLRPKKTIKIWHFKIIMREPVK